MGPIQFHLVQLHLLDSGAEGVFFCPYEIVSNSPSGKKSTHAVIYVLSIPSAQSSFTIVFYQQTEIKGKNGTPNPNTKYVTINFKGSSSDQKGKEENLKEEDENLNSDC